MTGAQLKAELDETFREMELKLEEIEQLASRIKKRLRAVDRLRKQVGDFPDYAEVPDDEDRPAGSEEPATQYLRIAKFLLKDANEPKSRRAIVAGTSLSESAVSQILHRTHKDKFVSTTMPGYSRKKIWSLTDDAAREATQQLHGRKADLFGDNLGDLDGLKATDCCERILKEYGNNPKSALSLAREALVRGYRGNVHGGADEVLLTTAKSFWAAMGRDERFLEVRPLVFALRSGGE